MIWPPEGFDPESCPEPREVLRDDVPANSEPVERLPGDLLEALENARYSLAVQAHVCPVDPHRRPCQGGRQHCCDSLS